MLLALAASLMATPAAFTLPAPAANALRQQLERMNAAALRDDDDAVVKSMYPKLVQAMGGSAQARKKVEEMRLGIKADGAVALSAKVGAIRGCDRVRKQVQCVVEGTQVIRVTGGRLFVGTETIAFSDDGGARWTFLSGGQDPEVLRSMFPELSPGLPLRPSVPPRFESD